MQTIFLRLQPPHSLWHPLQMPSLLFPPSLGPSAPKKTKMLAPKASSPPNLLLLLQWHHCRPRRRCCCSPPPHPPPLLPIHLASLFLHINTIIFIRHIPWAKICRQQKLLSINPLTTTTIIVLPQMLLLAGMASPHSPTAPPHLARSHSLRPFVARRLHKSIFTIPNLIHNSTVR